VKNQTFRVAVVGSYRPRWAGRTVSVQRLCNDCRRGSNRRGEFNYETKVLISARQETERPIHGGASWGNDPRREERKARTDRLRVAAMIRERKARLARDCAETRTQSGELDAADFMECQASSRSASCAAVSPFDAPLRFPNNLKRRVKRDDT
jgi:hypothetical protein